MFRVKKSGYATTRTAGMLKGDNMKDGDKFISNLKLQDSSPYYFNLNSVVEACIDGLVVKNGACFLTAPTHQCKIGKEKLN